MGVAVEAVDQSTDVLAAYQEFLLVQRRLAPLTVRTRCDVIRRFLRFRLSSGRLALAELTATDVHAFVVHEADRLSTGAARTALDCVRCFLRFLFATEVTALDLSGAVPGIAGYRHTAPPRAVDVDVLAALLAACDRTRPSGRRDYAVLLLMARLGLRAVEVARLQLEDLGWRTGELTVTGKGGYRDRLPLLPEVGEALVDYLRAGRPDAAPACREVFLRARPPVGPLGRNGVVMVPRHAATRAGLPVIGAHRLRHTTATELVRAGASLREVGQVLRHHSDQQTALYALVDHDRLAQLARPWPVAR